MRAAQGDQTTELLLVNKYIREARGARGARGAGEGRPWPRCLRASCSAHIRERSALLPDPQSARGDNCLSGLNREINEFISVGELSSSEQHVVL